MENYIYYIIDLDRFYRQSLKKVTDQIILFNFQIEILNNSKSDANFSSSNLMNIFDLWNLESSLKITRTQSQKKDSNIEKENKAGRSFLIDSEGNREWEKDRHDKTFFKACKARTGSRTCDAKKVIEGTRTGAHKCSRRWIIAAKWSYPVCNPLDEG